mgnify:CR=1 FL=1
MDPSSIGLATLQLVVLSVMLFGLLGLIIPVLPGLVIIWVPALIYGIMALQKKIDRMKVIRKAS